MAPNAVHINAVEESSRLAGEPFAELATPARAGVDLGFLVGEQLRKATRDDRTELTGFPADAQVDIGRLPRVARSHRDLFVLQLGDELVEGLLEIALAHAEERITLPAGGSVELLLFALEIPDGNELHRVDEDVSPLGAGGLDRDTAFAALFKIELPDRLEESRDGRRLGLVEMNGLVSGPALHDDGDFFGAVLASAVGDPHFVETAFGQAAAEDDSLFAFAFLVVAQVMGTEAVR